MYVDQSVESWFAVSILNPPNFTIIVRASNPQDLLESNLVLFFGIVLDCLTIPGALYLSGADADTITSQVSHQQCVSYVTTLTLLKH